ncbi:MAG TPA: RNA methyltransferase [Lachnoclostridium sp.]|nr:RNA methyltransferase [Lachnoclostridium sp.]
MEQQQETWKLPEAFVARMKAMLGDACDTFLASYEKERVLGLRVNTMKVPAAEFAGQNQALFSLRPVSWCREGFYYDRESRPGRHPYHEAGVYYIQEPSAMAVVALLGPKPGERVLDLCAAPGGKTTHIASCLEGRGLLVSNEIHPARAKILSQNVERMGIGNAVVTNEDSGTLASFFPEFFDCMVVDAPCSGEGMFRKDEQARNEWSEANVKLCAERQQEILDNAAEMLKPGGRMVYSTCTFAPEEDEAGISDFLKRHPEFSVVRLEPGEYPEGLSCGHPEWSQDQNTDLKYTFRIWPHESEGEGHYLALLKKDGAWASEDSRKRKQPKYWNDKAGRAYLGGFFEKSLTEEGYALLKDGMDQLILFGDQLYMLPDGMPALDRLRVLRPGLHLGEFKTKRFEPSHALSHFLKPQHAVSVCRLDPEDPQVLDYLKGNTVRGEAGLSGWTLVCIGEYPLGWGKAVSGVVKNHYPKGLRIQG